MEVMKKPNAEAMAAYLAPSAEPELERQGYELVSNTPEEFPQFMKADIARVAALVNEFGIRPE
jgi:tripartite-type tricarboxylate transporter receptor subunit TctC